MTAPTYPLLFQRFFFDPSHALPRSCSLIALLLCTLSGCVSTSQAGDLSRVFKRVNPAVVVISTKESYDLRLADGIEHVNTGGLGSGVIISADGLIMTAAHVVATADELAVTLADGRKYHAHVISSHPLADVALIQLDDAPKDLSFVAPADSDKARIGQQVFVIGAPYGLEHTLTVGHLSSRRKNEGKENIMDLEFLQTDAAVNQGNSGGPLFTHDGKLIGIVSHIRSQSGGSEGLGFCASINMAKQLLQESGVVWMGIQFIPLDGELAKAFNIPYQQGLLIQRVVKNSLGEKLLLREGQIPAKVRDLPMLIGGDIIVKVGQDTVYVNRAGRKRTLEYLQGLNSGDRISVTVIRQGEELELTTTLP